MDLSWRIIKEMIQKRNIFVNAVLGRSACVGQEVFWSKITSSHEKIRFINIQKGRLDLLLGWLNGQKRPRANIIKPYILSGGVFGLIKQQQSVRWLKIKNVEYLFMDTWSELADQKFTHKKEGWSFCCSFSDINYQTNFSEIFSYGGLLEDEQIVCCYRDFFTWWEKNHANKKIIIMFYSPKFDQREKFKERTIRINNLIKQEAKNIANVFCIELNDDQVFSVPSEYHYSEQTLQAYVDKWTNIEEN